jgi:hypothetical protein
MKTPEEIKQFNDFAAAVINALPRFLGPEMEKYTNDPDLKNKLEDFFNHEMYFKDSVNYAIPFDEVISLGNYEKVEDGITAENYDTKKKPETKDVVFKVVLIPEVMITEKVLTYFEAIKIRLATNYELAYFGYLHPELQKKDMINSLVCSKKMEGGNRSCLCLSRQFMRGGRTIVRSPFNDCHPKNRAFLGVYEESVTNQKK